MTDYATSWTFGEHRGPISTQIEVEYAGTITKGQPLQVSGNNDDGQVKVVAQSGASPVFAFALYDGTTGDVNPALKCGVIKGTVNGARSAGANLAIKAGKAEPRASDTSQICVTLLQTTTGNGDHTALLLVECIPGKASAA